MVEGLIPKTPQAEAEHQKFLKRCKDELDLMLSPEERKQCEHRPNGEASVGFLDIDLLLLQQVYKAKPIIKKQEREKFLEWLEYNAPESVWQKFKDNKDVRPKALKEAE